MKKIISVMLILLSIFAFVSCGCQETPDDPPAGDESQGGNIEDNPFPLIPIKPVS